MKKILTLIILIFSIASCTDRGERPLVEYKMFVKNETNQSFLLKITFGTTEVFSQNIPPNSSSQLCSFFDETIPTSGYYACGLNRNMELRFPNNKGYRCSNNLESGDNSLCLNNNRNLLGQVGYVNQGNNSFEFKITQDDYDNAYMLP